LSPRQTLLVVEDNPDDERLTLRALRRLNLPVDIQVARDGREALNTLESAETLPCLVLLDLKLPLVSGLEVLERIRQTERTRTLPVVVLTSSDEPSDVRRAYRLHANSFVQKPVDFVEFGQVVGEVGIYWLGKNVSPFPACL